MLWVNTFLFLCLCSLGSLVDLFLMGHVSLGQWALRPKSDGTFSRWQIVGQVVLLGPLAVACLWAMLWCLCDFARRLLMAQARQMSPSR